MTNDQLVEEIQQLRNEVKSEMENTCENLREKFDRLKHIDGLEAKRSLANIERNLASEVNGTLNSIEGVLNKISMTNDQLVEEIQQLRDQVKSETESIRENLREGFDDLKHIDGLEVKKSLANIERNLAFHTRGILNSIEIALKK